MGGVEVIVLLYRRGKIVLQSHRNNEVAHNRDILRLVSWCLKRFACKWLLLNTAIMRGVYTIFYVLFDAPPCDQEWVIWQIYRPPTVDLVLKLNKLSRFCWLIEVG